MFLEKGAFQIQFSVIKVYNQNKYLLFYKYHGYQYIMVTYNYDYWHKNWRKMIFFMKQKYKNLHFVRSDHWVLTKTVITFKWFLIYVQHTLFKNFTDTIKISMLFKSSFFLLFLPIHLLSNCLCRLPLSKFPLLWHTYFTFMRTHQQPLYRIQRILFWFSCSLIFVLSYQNI